MIFATRLSSLSRVTAELPAPVVDPLFEGGAAFVPRRVAGVEAQQRLEVLQGFRPMAAASLTRLGARLGGRSSGDNQRREQACSHAGQNT